MIPSSEHRGSTSEMRDVWSWALSWFVKPPSDAAKRARQAELVGAYLVELRSISTVEGLHERYCRDSRWCLDVARRLFLRDWPTLGVHACTATAYGVRYVEILTGRALDPRNLPAWVGEWAIW